MRPLKPNYQVAGKAQQQIIESQDIDKTSQRQASVLTIEISYRDIF